MHNPVKKITNIVLIMPLIKFANNLKYPNENPQANNHEIDKEKKQY